MKSDPFSKRRIEIAGHFTGISFPKILVLEDDPEFSAVLKMFLESVPFEVVSVENGVEGLREVMAGDFDAVVCDMMMPKLAGDMFYRAVERINPELCARFIFITGYRASERINAFIRQIRGTILLKPFHMDELRETIRFVLDTKSAA